MKNPRKNRAFTLVEVLLAMAITGMILTAIYASWMSVMRGTKAGLDAAAEAQRERIAQQTVETALGATLLFQANARYYAFLADTADEKAATLSFVTRLPDSFPGGGLFPNEPVRRITFAVEPAGNDTGVLTMRQSSVLLPTNAADTPFRIVLASNVMAFGLEFWDTNLNGGDWAGEWIASNTLPQMVRVSFAFGKPNAGGGHVAASVVALPSQGVAANVQVPQSPAPRPGVNINFAPQPGGGGITIQPRK